MIIRKINNRKYRGKPKHFLLKHYDKDTMIDVEFKMYSSIEYMLNDYYLSQPKSVLESLLAENFDKYPEKLKTLPYSKAPYYRHLTLKHQVFAEYFDGF